MPKDSLKKYCSLHKFLEQHEPDLYESFESVCMLSILRPKFGNGVTLLIPPPAEKKKLMDLVYGDDPDQAIPMLQSLVIFNYLPNAASWQSAAQTERGIVTASHQKLDVSVSGGDIVVADAKVALNKEFISFPERKNMAVWNMISGKLPLEGKAVAARSPTAKKTRTKSSYSGSAEDCACRIQLTKLAEEDMELCLAKGKFSDMYLKIIVSLLVFLKKDYAQEFDKLVKQMCFGVIPCFYKVMNLIDVQALSDFWSATGKRGVLPDESFTVNNKTHFDVFCSFYNNYAAKNTTGEMVHTMCEKKKRVLSQFCNKVQLAKAMLDAYEGNYLQAFFDDREFLINMAVMDMYEISDTREKLDIFKSKIVYLVQYIMNRLPNDAQDSQAFFCLNSKVADVLAWVCTTLGMVRSTSMGVVIPESMFDLPELGDKSIGPDNSTKLGLINQNAIIRDIQNAQYKGPSIVIGRGETADYTAIVAEVTGKA